MKTFLRVALWLALGAARAVAAAQALTLEQCLQTALEENPELLAARQNVEAVTGRAIQGRLWPNPDLELSAEDVPSGGGFSSSVTMIGVAQTVPFPGKRKLDSRIGRADVSEAEWNYLGLEIALVREVKAAFYRALGAQQKFGVSEELSALAGSLAEAAGKRVAAGAASDQERLRAEIEQDRVAVERTAAQREWDEARNVLALLRGRPREPIGTLGGALRETVPAVALDEARERMLADHPAVRAAQAHRELAHLELRRAKLEPWPDVTVGAAGGRDGTTDESLMEFRLSMPLPLFDRAQGRRREARALEQMAHFDVAAIEQRLVQELDALNARLRAAREQADVYRNRIVPKAEDALRQVRRGFDAGKFGFLDVVDTQRTVAEARLAYFDTLIELNTAQADMDALLLIDTPYRSTLEPSEGEKP